MSCQAYNPAEDIADPADRIIEEYDLMRERPEAERRAWLKALSFREQGELIGALLVRRLREAC